MKEVLVSFKHNTYYGRVDAIYIMSLEDWKKILFLQNEGYDIYLGEIAGKHSDVRADVDDFMIISKDEDEIENFKKLFGRTFGSYRPFDSAMELYEEVTYEEEEEDEDY
jgi:hypothetical protein